MPTKRKKTEKYSAKPVIAELCVSMLNSLIQYKLTIQDFKLMLPYLENVVVSMTIYHLRLKARETTKTSRLKV